MLWSDNMSNTETIRRSISCGAAYDQYDQETASIMRLADYATGDSMRKRAERAAKEKREARITLWIMIGVMAFFALLGLIFR